MQFATHLNLSGFFIAGVSYKKSDASLRGQYAVNGDQYQQAASLAHVFGIENFLILSTCNRTEIYGFAPDARSLANLLTSVTAGNTEEFLEIAYVKNGCAAVEHLFSVAAGLDSQILGDYEIVGQIKQAAKTAKAHNCLGCIMERMVNEVLQACKKIRTTTALSGGTVSVSFAAVQYIRNRFPDLDGKKVLLIGTGKFGGNTCKNITDYLPGVQLTLINRTVEKARTLAEEYGVKFDQIGNMDCLISDADVILVATSADEPVVVPSQFVEGNQKLVIDLSIPYNVDPRVASIDGVHLVNVDELSRIKDETLQKRALEIPKAKQIISDHIEAFREWHQMREHVPVLKAIKSKLLTIQTDRIFDNEVCVSVSSITGKSAEERIQKVINGMAVKMKTRNQRGCNYIEAINDFISPASV